MSFIDIKKKGLKCERCGHEWIRRSEKIVPVVCPRCKSPYWWRPKNAKKARPF